MAQQHWTEDCKVEILGYVNDSNGIGYSRDIGRSFVLGGNIYYIFGDTFCKNAAGEFVGLISNSVALVPNPSKPLESTYLNIQYNGIVEPFLVLDDDELRLEKENPEQRVTLWAFGGVVETAPSLGYVWYQKGIEHKGTSPRHEFCGAGLASVRVRHKNQSPVASRLPGMLFEANDPKIGSFSAICDGHYVYLYGERGNDMIVARVPYDTVDRRSTYEFWSNGDWKANEHKDATTLFSEIPQGQIFKQSGQSAGNGSFRLIGVSKWADSRIRLGYAPRPEGPWTIREVATATGINCPDSYMYCIYPHTWAFSEKSEQELMITWSEHWPGGVVAAVMELEEESEPNIEQGSLLPHTGCLRAIWSSVSGIL